MNTSTNGVRVRKAVLDDLMDIQHLNHDLFIHDNDFNHDLNLNWPHTGGEQYFRDYINRPEQFLSIVAVENNQVVGYLNARIQETDAVYIGRRAEVENMCVREAVRSKGVGTLLMSEFKQWAKEKGASRLMVEAFSANERAIRFYEKNGFKPYALIMSQELNS